MRQAVLVVVLALLAWVGIGRAHAQSGTTIEQAYANCQVGLANWNDYEKRSDHECVNRPTQSRFELVHPGSSGHGFFPYSVGCPAGSNWDSDTGTCATSCGDDGWPDPNNPGQCLNAGKCLDRASLGNTIIGSYASSICMAGCEFGPPGGGVPSGTMLGDGSVLTFGGGWAPTGNSCADVPPDIPPPSEDETCTTQPGNGMTICVKPDGRHCYSAKTPGRQICWNPAETGEKTDGPTKQVRNAGDTPIPPSLNLPSGDTLEQAESTTTQTTINNNTSTTTTTNYNTQHGTDAGPPQGSNQGEDGDGGDGEGDGEGDGDVQGGGDCSSPPSCSGNPLSCWAIQHNWRQACEAADSDLFGGALGEVMDAFANEQAAEAVEWGAELGSDGEGDLDLHREVRDIPVEDLDDSGFLPAGKCPQFDTPTVNGKALPINFAPMCGMLENVGYLVLGLAYFLAFRIIGGGGRK